MYKSGLCAGVLSLPKNIEKLVFVSTGTVLVLGLAFGAGLYSGAKRNAAYDVASGLGGALSLVLAERENLVQGRPVDFLQPSQHEGSGVTVNGTGAGDDSLVFLSGFFGEDNGLRLMRRDGTVLAEWTVRFSEHFPDSSFLYRPPQTDRNVDLHGALLLPDGSAVFNYEYAGTVKLDRCGATEWTLEHPTHHSIERAADGGYWIPGRAYIPNEARDAYPPFTWARTNGSIADDLILRVSEEGQIIGSKSITEMLYENGLEALMTATGYSFSSGTTWDGELVHANKIGELPFAMAAAFPGFAPGDLLLSLRQYNLILVVDPVTWEVKWHQTGPWLRQHDPEFLPDGTITVFNNNAYKVELGPKGRVNPNAPKDSNIVQVNPTTGETWVAYGDGEGETFSSVVRGKHEVMPGGGFLITEFEAGRVFQTDAEGEIVWEYINRYDDEEVLEMTEARVYPAGYFTVTDWSCP